MCASFVIESIALGLALATPLVIVPAIIALGTIGLMIHRSVYPEYYYPDFYNTQKEQLSQNLTRPVIEACGRSSQIGIFSRSPILPQPPTVELDTQQLQPGL